GRPARARGPLQPAGVGAGAPRFRRRRRAARQGRVRRALLPELPDAQPPHERLGRARRAARPVDLAVHRPAVARHGRGALRRAPELRCRRQRVAHPAAVGARALPGRQRPRPLAARRPGPRCRRGHPVAWRRGRGEPARVRGAARAGSARPDRLRGVIVRLKLKRFFSSPRGALLALGAAVALTGCSDTGEGDTRRALLERWSTELIVPLYADFEQRSDAVAGAVEALCAAPSEASLGAARTAWDAAREPFKRAEVFAFGPYSRPEFRIGPKIDSWPARPADVEEWI